MGGVVVGSTMENIVSTKKQWGAVMINTGCNLDCPTCYLGEKSSNRNMTQEVASKLANLAAEEQWDGIAIIGTEPLFDQETVRIINIFGSAIKTHVMTNGANLEKFAADIQGIKRLDVSLDGGPKTYPRNGSFTAIQRGVLKFNGPVYAVNTLYRENLANIEDMLEGSRLLKVAGTFFSPYVRTLGGNTMAKPLKTVEIIQALLPFSGGDWKFMVDPYHAIFEWVEWEKIREETMRLPAKNRLIVDFDPGEIVRRIGVDGKEKHPFLALHPGIKLTGRIIV